MAAPVRLARGYRQPRRGATAEECEDAFAIDASCQRIAVADGASESFLAGVWARLLVEQFTVDPAPWPDWIARAQPLWDEQVRRQEQAPRPWYLDERFRQGAFATFVGLVFSSAHVDAVAVGDSCLFHVRGDALIQSFPLDRAEQFGNTPWLIGSRFPPEEVPRRHGSFCHLEVQPGDRLWLMTDALARWFLTEVEAGRRPWHELAGLVEKPDEAWVHWVEDLRDRRELRNDDATMVVLEIGDEIER